MGLFGKILADAASSYAAKQNPAKRGMLISGIPNYKPGHYGPTEGATKLRDAVVSDTGSKYYKPVSKAIFGADHLLGYGTLAKEGAKSALQMQLPSNRVVYMEGGVNKPVMERELLKTDANTPEYEWTGRGLYNRHVTEGTGQVPLSGENKLDPILERLGYGDYTDMSKGFYADKANRWTEDITETVRKKDRERIENHISKVWEDKYGVPIGEAPDARFLMKRVDGYGGKHRDDFQRSKEVGQIAEQIFGKGKKNPKNPEELLERMLAMKVPMKDTITGKELKMTNPFTGKKEKIYRRVINPKTIDKDDTGVWFSFSRAGSAITEGGANFLVKVEPNGRVMFVMSDEHDFLEKIPGVAEIMNNRVLAATVPTYINLKTVKKGQTGGKSKAGRPQTRDTSRRISPEAKKEKKALGWQSFGEDKDLSLPAYVKGLRPQDQELYNRELKKAYGKLTGGTGLLGYSLSEDK